MSTMLELCGELQRLNLNFLEVKDITNKRIASIVTQIETAKALLQNPDRTEKNVAEAIHYLNHIEDNCSYLKGFIK